MKKMYSRMLAALTLCIGGTCVLAADWPCWQGPNHDGKSTETGLLKQWPEGGPELLWKVDTIGEGFSTVSVSQGTTYTSGDVDGQLFVFAFDPTGKSKWRTAVDKAWKPDPGGSRSTPTVDGSRVYVLSGNGVLACMDAATGQVKWSKKMRDFGGGSGGWGYAESVLILGDMAIAKPGGQSFAVAFDKATGDVRWKSQGFNAGPEYSSCVPFTFNGTDLIATGSSGGIVCLSPKTGKTLWSNDFAAGNTANCPDPEYSDGYVFWANGYGKGAICLKLSGSGDSVRAQEVYRTEDMDCHHGGYIIKDGCVYGNHKGTFVCMDLKTGEIKWRERSVGKGSLCYADGMLYLYGESNGKAALSTCRPDGVEIRGRVSVEGSGPSWAHPVVASGRLYLRYAQNLYCFDISEK